MTDLSTPADQHTAAVPVAPATGLRRGAGLTEVTLHDGFWKRMQDANSTATLQHSLDWMERLGWIANFDRVATGTTGPDRPGWQFSDSEIYKLLEALAWEHGRTGDTAVNAMFDRLVDRVLLAEDADGYLNTCYGHDGQAPRYSDLESGHELYCAGHLIQAAVARLRTSGEDRFTALGRRVADHVCREFGEDARQGICGHPEIEVALMELARATGEERYRRQAELFIERRGHGTLAPIPLLGAAYFQDSEPVRATTAWHGHAVRALYLAAAAVDLAVDRQDAELLEILEGQWHRTVERRTYITGGMGSRHQDEGFGDDWELPPDRAYCETCAGIASNMVSWRLYLATGRVEYVDLMERTLFNVIATSPSDDGRAFFYANPLQQRVAGTAAEPDAVNARAEGGERAPWFEVSCCPTNLARTLASFTTSNASVDDEHTLTILQYAAGRIRSALPGGELNLRVSTRYPDDGAIRIDVDSAPSGAILRLRVPSWAKDASLRIDSEAHAVSPGWITIDDLQAGAQIDLRLPLVARFSWPDLRIDAMRGTVAVERGPLVYCLEAIDLPQGASLDDVQIDANSAPFDDGEGGVLVSGSLRSDTDRRTGQPPFTTTASDHGSAAPFLFPLTPYHRWAERGPTAMRVFLPAQQ